MTIPRLIHQMWLDTKTDDNITPTGKYVKLGYPASLQHKNPSYNYLFWNMTRVKELFKLEPYSKYLDFFLNLKHHIEKCDLARYIILHKYGGFYFDLDVEAINPIPDSYLDREIMLILEPVEMLNSAKQKTVSNGILASKKGYKFWLDFIDYIIANYKRGGKSSVLTNTGPYALATFIEQKYPAIFKSLSIKDTCQFSPYASLLVTSFLSKDCVDAKPSTIVHWEKGSYWIVGLSDNVEYDEKGRLIVRDNYLTLWILIAILILIILILIIVVIILSLKRRQ